MSSDLMLWLPNRPGESCWRNYLSQLRNEGHGLSPLSRALLLQCPESNSVIFPLAFELSFTGMDNIWSTPFRGADFIIPWRVRRTGSSFLRQGGRPLMRT